MTLGNARYYVGLSATYHDPALAIVDASGDVVFAEATERYLQSKRALNAEPDQLFLVRDLLLRHCRDAEEFVIATNWRRRRNWRQQAVALLGWLDREAMLARDLPRYSSPLETHKINHMLACQRSAIGRAGTNLASVIRDLFPRASVCFRDYDHHATHAAMGCYASPFDTAVCAVIDSFGERGGLAVYEFDRGRLRRLHEDIGLSSLGFYYMKLTELCGFDWLRGEEWKVMGLAAYGRPDAELHSLLKATIGSRGPSIRHRRAQLMAGLAALEAKRPDCGADPLAYADWACTGQLVFEETLLNVLKHVRHLSSQPNLVLTGGCALNSSCNGKVLASSSFERLFVPSAPADDGTALGAAWLAYHADHPNAWQSRAEPLTPYLGHIFDGEALARMAAFSGLAVEDCGDSVPFRAAATLARGKVIGWLQGAAEFGPRALGNRSILADPRPASMKGTLNSRVKFREAYRPFAPAILHSHGAEYFHDYRETPYMERALVFREHLRECVPAVVHADGTGRLQTVKAAWNPRLHTLVDAFWQQTGIPVVLNTSFNVMGKPIAHSLEDALSVFLTTGLDALFVDRFRIAKPGCDERSG